MQTTRFFARAIIRTLAGVALASVAHIAVAQIVVPNDAKATCVVTGPEFQNWFASGTVTANGIVDPADSVTFSNIPNCDFYKWSEQMFLWLLSPAPSKYGAGAHVFNSRVFYDVTPQDANGNRKFVPNGPGILKNFVATIQQTGPQRKPVIFDDAGRRFNVIETAKAPSGLTHVPNAAGQLVEVARTGIAPSGAPLLFDRENREINVPLALNGNLRLLNKANQPIALSNQKIIANGKSFFLDAFGNAISTEQGEADGQVLFGQNGQPVYYGLHANDVFAYFATGQIDHQIAPPNAPFPTTAAQLNAIKAFGLAHSKTFPDANALTVELKTAWIETAGLANANQYITINATVPNYTQKTSTQWTATGTRQATLALVGMHVVGSTSNHPEMLWATFEHVNNAPNDAYSYRLANNSVKNVLKNQVGTWLFSANNPPGPTNQKRQFASGTGITAMPGQTIGPANVLRLNPWGTNPTAAQAVNNDTDIISINNSVLTQLAAGDIRKNYIMTGTTWTINGAPSQPSSNQVGTNRMANTAMETFSQTTNCFGCHDFAPAFPTDVSHIYPDMLPLFP